MIFRPAGRFFTGPLPPLDFAARLFAAVIRPPLLFFAIMVFWFLDLPALSPITMGEPPGFRDGV
jgi:hypothetical protein